MASSMTGFSRRSGERGWGRLSVELSSVNSRYLEVQYKSNRNLASLEPYVTNYVRSRFARGKIVVRAELHTASETVEERLDVNAVRNCYQKLASLADELGIQPPSLGDVLRLPVTADLQTSDDEPDLQSLVEETLALACDDMAAMRLTEGRALVSDISANLEEWAGLVEQLSSRWNEISGQAFDGYRQKIKETLERWDAPVDENRLVQELVILADKWDISEELSRSRSHIDQFRNLLKGEGPIGRKMDFLLQEMNREINTVGSKAASTELRWLVVDGKNLLERIREQVQNVE